MSDRFGQVERITLPFRMISYRLSMVLMIGLSCALLLLGRAEAYVFDEAREKVQEATAPILELLSTPVGMMRQWFSGMDDFLNVYEENRRLRDENARLLEWQAVALELQQTNERLEALLNVQAGPGIGYITARVIGDSGGPFVHAFIVNAGEVDRAAKGQAVIDTQGLVGHVVAVGEHSSRVLLISDLNSRVPIVFEDSYYKAVMVGDNSPLPLIEFLGEDDVLTPGKRVVTSGHGGLLPPGLPVGIVVRDESGLLRVDPYSEESRVDHVRLLEFEFPNDVDEEGAEETDGEQVGLLNSDATAGAQ